MREDFILDFKFVYISFFLSFVQVEFTLFTTCWMLISSSTTIYRTFLIFRQASFLHQVGHLVTQ